MRMTLKEKIIKKQRRKMIITLKIKKITTS